MTTDRPPESITRSCVDITVEVSWPRQPDRLVWNTLPKDVRNAIRQHMDDITDLLAEHV